LDLSVHRKLDHVEHPESAWTPFALQAKRTANCLAFHDRLVDEEVLAVEPLGASDVTLCHIGEKRLIERTGVLTPVRGAGGPAYDVMCGARSQGCHNTLDVIRGLLAEVLVEKTIHLFARQCHLPVDSFKRQANLNGIVVSCKNLSW